MFPVVAASQGLGVMRHVPDMAVLRHQSSQSDTPARRPLHEHDNFFSGASAMYLETLYQSWKADRSSVDPSWDAVFGAREMQSYDTPILSSAIRVLPTTSEDTVTVQQSLKDCGWLTWMIQAFESRGHLVASTDPLGKDDDKLSNRAPLRNVKEMLRLDLAFFGFTPNDYNRVVRVGFQDEVGGVLNTHSCPMTIKELHEYLTKRFCGKVGYELSHIVDKDVSRFLREVVESDGAYNPLHRTLTKEEKMWAWDLVASSVHFEDFFKRKYSTQKRFGADGAESVVLGLRALMEAASKNGVERVHMAMAHRGRLNVLYHVIGKPFPVILKEFTGITGPELEPYKIQSDVKYHLGARSTMKMRNGKSMITELLPNPSHLEAVNPVLQGYTRAVQESMGENGPSAVLPVEIHGDAAFSGQGIVFETMCISEVDGYSTHGTVHVVVNNQIGFTTDPICSRSSAHCTDLGRVFQCPILHVNGDSPEDVVRVFQFAADFRAKFKKSIVIDLVCYRRFGHNENDDPTITQPLMYNRINAVGDLFKRYSENLVAEGIITSKQQTAKSIAEKERYGKYQAEASQVHYSSVLKSSIPEKWKDMTYSDQLGDVKLEPTAVSLEQLKPVIDALKVVPDGFVVHPKLKSVLDRRNETIEKGEGIDWGAAEALAFGSLVLEGTQVRLLGEDVERGTFSQRHAVLHDQKVVDTYVPLAHISKDQAPFVAINSPLSEYGVLGFASGFSLYDPNSLVVWEAQYGDFANGATIIFDQFVSSGESKWNQQQAIVVSLPHGYDGRGAEHSSGRIERFLQAVSEDVSTPAYSPEERAHRVNMEVVFPSTPAQYFHLLRRHVRRDFRKPLILFFSKQFIRAPNESTMDEITSGKFRPVIEDASVPPEKARRVVLCTGQLYHILKAHRNINKNTDVAIVRIEELSPFPVAEVQKLLGDYSKAELMWAQEEPRNQGAYYHVGARIDFYTGGKRELMYAGRDISASPSTGYKSMHDAEERHICEVVFS
ncbi:putative alpha-ketoglutarate dehydrogenase complex subunit Kgd1 [Trypanosoma rangeli]|uniref:oxoglutarate dehydrogenase (succinyl-transferring) n=1 Tax=Trypanosoma rangeli TaxID=5698 RepID=A0A3R7KVU5_TRYRA|nr:putative alpha-ketoglutarate dehydrogenase complex subunit Kgd1 [Trypanosoma rangeli]RNF02364.1 putative alpha-ketoglutarate dehydrogenase complex subunit Kgd1 [Trypanosoma rangeli]|eukprot:RNF02364.1 putative alpha-ketoglutarate dehydrogenase complex subunit Kgd1 [Trypanosoma rangeli]